MDEDDIPSLGDLFAQGLGRDVFSMSSFGQPREGVFSIGPIGGVPIPKQTKLFPDLDRIRDLLDRADRKLPGPAQEAITGFVGHKPMSREPSDFMSSIGIMNARPLEQALRGDDPRGILSGIEKAFAPVRAQLHEEYGSTLPLSRVQHPVEQRKSNVAYSGMPEDTERRALSWTADPDFARSHAGARKEQRLFTDRDIAEAEARHAATGETVIPGTRYRLKGQNSYTDSRGQPRTSLDIYHGDEFVTDADDVRGFMRGLNTDRSEANAANAERLGRIIDARVPLNDILYGTHRAGQTEFIVRNQPGQQVWIDPTGQRRGR